MTKHEVLKKCIYIKHQQKNTQTTRSDHCPGFSCCTLTTQGCGGNPGFYRSFSCVNKTPKHKPRLKTHQNQKALLPEGASDSLRVCVSSCCLHTAKATASLQAWDWPLCARGFKGHCGQQDCTGGQPQWGSPGFPLSLSPSPVATSAEFAPVPLVRAWGVRSLLGAGPPWS